MKQVTLYTTSIAMQPAARQKQEYLIRTLNALRIPYEQCDVSMDEESKKVWRRKGRTNGQLPGFLVDGEWVGDFEEFEYAVEDGVVPSFLGLDSTSLHPVRPTTAVAPPPPSSTPPTSSHSGPSPSISTPASSSRSRPPPTISLEDEEHLNSMSEADLARLLSEMELETKALSPARKTGDEAVLGRTTVSPLGVASKLSPGKRSTVPEEENVPTVRDKGEGDAALLAGVADVAEDELERLLSELEAEMKST